MVVCFFLSSLFDNICYCISTESDCLRVFLCSVAIDFWTHVCAGSFAMSRRCICIYVMSMNIYIYTGEFVILYVFPAAFQTEERRTYGMIVLMYKSVFLPPRSRFFL